MPTRKHVVLGSLFVLMLLIILPAQAQSRQVYWERWDVLIDNIDTTDNRFDVQESYEVRFTGQFTFGSAIIEDTRLESIRNISVSEAGRALQASCSGAPGTFCVEQVQEGTSITYYFRQPISNNVQSFIIEYTVVGALRVYEGGDQLWWSAIPDEHFGFGIGSSTITVIMPDGYGPREGIDPIEIYGPPGEITVRGTQIQAIASRPIGGEEAFEIRVQYPHDPNARVASWQEEWDDRRDYEENTKPLVDIGMIGASLLVVLGGPLAFFGLWYARGRDPKVGPVPEYLSEPPSDLPPAVVGALVDEKADVRDVLSTVIDLASRGYIVIEENRKEGIIFGIGASSSFIFKRTDKDLSDLRSFEKDIIKRVFPGKKMERTLESLKNKFYKYIPELQKDLYSELVSEGLFSANPNSTRGTYAVIAAGVLAIAVFLGFLLFGQVEQVSESLLCLPAALGFSGVIGLGFSQFMPAKTRKGAEEAAKWGAFRQFLSNLEKYMSPEEVAERFDQYLPYAVAFGQDRSWIRKFSNVPTTPIPTWYFPTYRGGYYSRGYTAGSPVPDVSRGLPSAKDVLPGDLARAGGGGFSLDDMAGDLTGGLESISSGLTNMLESASRTITSRPQSSGSSGRWGSGGSSWSGGGFSGGGSSGGGSRGFG